MTVVSILINIDFYKTQREFARMQRRRKVKKPLFAPAKDRSAGFERNRLAEETPTFFIPRAETPMVIDNEVLAQKPCKYTLRSRCISHRDRDTDLFRAK